MWRKKYIPPRSTSFLHSGKARRWVEDGGLFVLCMIHYEHRPTQTLWLRLHGKGELITFVCLIGKEKGNKQRVTKERFKLEFKKLKKEEIGKFFKEKQHTKIKLPEVNATQQK